MEGLILDIDRRRQAEQAARQASENLRDAIESLDHNMLLYDRDDRLVLFTRHIFDQYPGGERFYVPGRTFEQIFRDVVEANMAQIPAGMTREQFIAERVEAHRKADGSIIVRKLPDGRTLHISEHRSQSGGTISIGRDVTHQLKVETQLREAQRMDAIGRLTGGLAHDLNNYLAVIIGNLDLLADFDAGNPEMRSLIDGAMGGAQRGAELTRSLLAFSRRQPLDAGVLDVGERVRDVARLLERTIGEKIVVQLAIGSGLWPVRIDGAQLDSAIVNLANNARDAMPEGGKLTIAVRNVQSGQDDDAPAGEHLLIEMVDEGLGMAPETVAQAFEPFFTTKGAGHGTGLGLSMVHGFVNQSGGTVRIASVQGKGTTVRLYLPRSLDAQPRSAGRGRDGALPGGSEHILLVEDNEHVRKTAVEQLVSLGYRVTEAENAEIALALLEAGAGEFDMVFSDIVMPGALDGYALAREVARRWPEARLLLTTGFASETAGDEAGAGLTVLRKPYRKADLAKTLRMAFEV